MSGNEADGNEADGNEADGNGAGNNTVDKNMTTAMKKFFYLAIALVGMALSVACSSDDGAAQKAVGSYVTERSTNLLGLPPGMSFETVHDVVTVRIKAVSGDFVSVTLPAQTYTLGGQEMAIPALTVGSVPVLADGEGGAAIPAHSFMMKSGNRDVTGRLEGCIGRDGGLELDVRIDRYGSMPFGIHQEYASVKR